MYGIVIQGAFGRVYAQENVFTADPEHVAFVVGEMMAGVGFGDVHDLTKMHMRAVDACGAVIADAPILSADVDENMGVDIFTARLAAVIRI